MQWRFLSADKETDHRFLNLFTLHYEVTKEDGSISHYPYFVASRNELDQLQAKNPHFDRPDAVVLCLYYQDPNTEEVSVIITTQFRPALGRYLTSFPAGLLDPQDKDEIEAAKREALEESGVVIDDIEVISPPSPTSSGLSDEVDSLLLARIVEFKEKRLEEFEDIRCRLVPLKEIPNILEDTAHYVVPLTARLMLRYLLERFR